MNSILGNPRFLGGALCALVLAGCDSIRTVEEEPATELPPQTVVLEGTILGLSSLRSVTLMNNNNAAGARSFLAPAPSVPNFGEAVVPFSFGSVPVGSSYSITVKDNPFGRTCVVNNGTGTITTATALNIQVVCTNTRPRFDLTVTLPATPAAFTAIPGAKVRVTTEEQIYERTVTSGQTSVFFDDVLFSAAGELNNFTYAVTATIPAEGGVLSKCTVTNATGTNPTANPVNPVVGACTFTIGGNIGYSQPPGVTYVSRLISGLELQLRDTQASVKETLVVPNCTATTITTTCAYTFAFSSRSNVGSVYDVAVSKHPTGMFCVVANGSAANLFTLGATTNPVNVTNANIRCRALPTPQKRLSGIYRLDTTTYLATLTSTPVISRYTVFDTTIQNTGSSNMISFFDDGSFLYGTHATAVQVEHGFYDYDPAAAKIRFSLITDTNTGATFPTNFAITPSNSAASLLTNTNGISALPGGVTDAASIVQRSMTGVTFGTDVGPLGTARTLSGTFGGDATAPFAAAASRVSWLLQEPDHINGEMTGAWQTQDHRRFWVWDYRTYYGTHVGVAGGAVSMNDACFTMEDLHASEGIYTRRGTITLCIPFARPAAGNTNYLVGFAESVDFTSPASASVPGFIGRMPGGQSAADGRSPSPIRFKIQLASAFQHDTTYFPVPANPLSSWCSTEILAIRTTLHDNPIDYPLYFCRTRVVPPAP